MRRDASLRSASHEADDTIIVNLLKVYTTKKAKKETGSQKRQNIFYHQRTRISHFIPQVETLVVSAVLGAHVEHRVPHHGVRAQVLLGGFEQFQSTIEGIRLSTELQHSGDGLQKTAGIR